tara:strand:- start:33 stop:302 length:270 start_codon:yes stop_codon:yes gene_type:complete
MSFCLIILETKKIKIIPTFCFVNRLLNTTTKNKGLIKHMTKTLNTKTLLNNIRNELIKTNDIHLINFEKNIKDKELKLLFDIIQNRKTK